MADKADIKETIIELAEKYGEEKTKFDAGNKSAGTRARKLLQEIKTLAQEGREEILAAAKK